jgi:hypothetical protein
MSTPPPVRGLFRRPLSPLLRASQRGGQCALCRRLRRLARRRGGAAWPRRLGGGADRYLVRDARRVLEATTVRHVLTLEPGK